MNQHPPTPTPTLTRLPWWPQGSELVGGALLECVCVCMLQCLRQIRTKVRACDLPPHHSYLGQGVHTPTHICHLFPFPGIFWYSMNCSINILICMCACSQTVLRTLEVMPWAADKPSFSAELSRIITYIASPQVGYTTLPTVVQSIKNILPPKRFHSLNWKQQINYLIKIWCLKRREACINVWNVWLQ